VHAIYFLAKNFRGKFIIPPSVEYECVTHPRKVKMHALHALRIARSIRDGMVEVLELEDYSAEKKILFYANNSFFSRGRPLELLHRGEAEALALASELGLRDILIDERTTRVLAEQPREYAGHLSKEFGGDLRIDERNLDGFLGMVSGMRFYRSSEILLLAYERGYFDDYGNMKEEALEAALYKLKYSGCAITENEIGQAAAMIRER